MAKNQFDEAATMAHLPLSRLPFVERHVPQLPWTQDSLTTEPRTASDIICAKQRFKVRIEGATGDEKARIVHTFTVQCGSVSEPKTLLVIFDASGVVKPPLVIQ